MLASFFVSFIGILYPIITRDMLNELIPDRQYRMIVFSGLGLLVGWCRGCAAVSETMYPEYPKKCRGPPGKYNNSRYVLGIS